MQVKPYQKEAVYQVYCRSFCDSNGDGIGDIPGIISKLDYIQSLGVGIIWLNPVYKSPQFDMGYDVSDYYSINPEYGTMEDFDRLLAEASKRGLRIVMDLVANHTSSQHPWFIASQDPASPYRDYYYWREGKKKDGKVPPNNWTNMFSGPAWTYDPASGQWYLHLFAPEQPDLNWHNPKVLEEVEGILRFWLDKGVYGFRCDMVNIFWKESLEDGKGRASFHRGMEHYLSKEGNHQILRRLREDVFSHYDCVVIGETFDVDIPNGIRFLQDQELDMFFCFEHMDVDAHGAKKFKARKMREVLYKWQAQIPWLGNYFENHDQPRSIERFGDAGQFFKESAKALACINFGLRGTPFVYQGEEIGMTGLPAQDPMCSQDVTCRTVYQSLQKLPFLSKRKIREICSHVDRDRCRAPMQWNGALGAGFSTSSQTWLPVNGNYEKVNVEAQEKDPSSILAYYRAIIGLHRSQEVMQMGDFHPLPSKGDVFAFERVLEGERVRFLVNFGKKAARLPAGLVVEKTARLLLGNYDSPGDPDLLRPYEARILQL